MTVATGKAVPPRFLQASQPNANSFAGTVQNEDEWRYQIQIQFEERRQCLNREFRTDVTRPQVDDSEDRLTRHHCQSAEIRIVRENDAARLDSPSKDFSVWCADQARFPDAQDVATYRA